VTEAQVDGGAVCFSFRIRLCIACALAFSPSRALLSVEHVDDRTASCEVVCAAARRKCSLDTPPCGFENRTLSQSPSRCSTPRSAHLRAAPACFLLLVPFSSSYRRVVNLHLHAYARLFVSSSNADAEVACEGLSVVGTVLLPSFSASPCTVASGQPCSRYIAPLSYEARSFPDARFMLARPDRWEP